MHQINHTLSLFKTITLEEMDSVKLMDRTDTKFTFNIKQLPEVLQLVKDDYRVLEIEGKQLSRYKTLYYDTVDLELYNRHHCGQLNRYKIRHRTYIESNIGFVEVKFKNNKGRTIKNRVKNFEAPQIWEGKPEAFLTSTLPFSPAVLVPTIWVNYSRLTLVNKHSAERLTIDLDLEFIKDDKTINLSNLVIAEVKQEKRKASPILAVLKNLHIREGSISKYCMGIAMTTDNIKKNNFKPKLLNIQKILSL